ncbi:MAG: pantoate--beta-alanine ligase [Spirochaetia bacterium]|nr:pantoate--beta-alanine ligase [Spirochaetia bacterium]
MKIFENLHDFRAWRSTSGNDIGFVPTMGYLHEGHFSLVRESKRNHALTVVSIFVNPTQFAAGEDLSRYPRDFAGDSSRLRDLGVDALFFPTEAEMYPPGFGTWVNDPEADAMLCGPFRPGHFRGVLTVVLKFFRLVKPKTAYFGKKDYQQFFLIKRMARDLELDVEVAGLDTIREASGLAMSSRNAYLSVEEKQQAAFIYQTLKGLKTRILAGDNDAASLEKSGREALSEKGFRVDYVEIRNRENLRREERANAESIVFAAAHLGKTRLIDNLEVGAGSL